MRITGLGTLRATPYLPGALAGDGRGRRRLRRDNPVYVELPGATPSKMVVAARPRTGTCTCSTPPNLGGMGGHKVDFRSPSSGMAIHTAPAAYRTAMGLVRRVLDDDRRELCPGGGSGRAVMSVLHRAGRPAGADGGLVRAAGERRRPGRSSTTTDGTDDAVVWYMNDGKLNGVDGDTGARYSPAATAARTCSSGPRPSPSKGASWSAATATSAPGQPTSEVRTEAPMTRRLLIGLMAVSGRLQSGGEPRWLPGTGGHQRRRGTQRERRHERQRGLERHRGHERQRPARAAPRRHDAARRARRGTAVRPGHGADDGQRRHERHGRPRRHDGTAGAGGAAERPARRRGRRGGSTGGRRARRRRGGTTGPAARPTRCRTSRCCSTTRTRRATALRRARPHEDGGGDDGATPGFTARSPATMYASPLYWQNGQRRRLVIVGDDQQQRLRVQRDHGREGLDANIGSSRDSGAGCGDIHPLGIESTGVIDAARGTSTSRARSGRRTIQRAQGARAEPDTGTEMSGWPVDRRRRPLGQHDVQPLPQNQRGALTLVGGDVLRRRSAVTWATAAVPRLGGRHHAANPA